MRGSLALLFLVACGGGGGGGGGMPDAPDVNGTPVIDVTSTDVMLQPGQEVTYCYYFHTTNTASVAINKWVGDMTPGSHHMIFYTGGASHADGLDTNNSCGFGGSFSSGAANWTYSQQTPQSELDLPADDGTGKPLAQVIAPNTQGSIQMHYLNVGDTVLTVHVNLKGYALPEGTAYTQTAAYATYNNSISIGPGATNVTATGTCPKPPGQFWELSTHAHKQAIHTDVKDGTAMMVESTDWEHPTVKLWTATPFYTVGATDVTWDCTYNNTGDNSANTITAGTSAQTDEMCMAVGYFFPATAAKGCLYDTQIPTSDHCYCQ